MSVEISQILHQHKSSICTEIPICLVHFVALLLRLPLLQPLALPFALPHIRRVSSPLLLELRTVTRNPKRHRAESEFIGAGFARSRVGGRSSTGFVGDWRRQELGSSRCSAFIGRGGVDDEAVNCAHIPKVKQFVCFHLKLVNNPSPELSLSTAPM